MSCIRSSSARALRSAVAWSEAMLFRSIRASPALGSPRSANGVEHAQGLSAEVFQRAIDEVQRAPGLRPAAGALAPGAHHDEAAGGPRADHDRRGGTGHPHPVARVLEGVQLPRLE